MNNLDIILFAYITIVFFGYLTYVVAKYGVLKSISDSYYLLRSKWLFTLFIWSIALPMIILGVNLTGLFFGAGALLAFVGAAPAFRNAKTESIVHVAGATGGILLGFLALVKLDMWVNVVVGVLAIIVLKKLNIKNSTWWIEIVAFITIVSSLLMYRL